MSQKIAININNVLAFEFFPEEKSMEFETKDNIKGHLIRKQNGDFCLRARIEILSNNGKEFKTLYFNSNEEALKKFEKLTMRVNFVEL